jgi:hypothetical protein
VFCITSRTGSAAALGVAVCASPAHAHMGGAEVVPLMAGVFGLLVGATVALMPSRFKPWAISSAAAIPTLAVLVSIVKDAQGPGNQLLEALGAVSLFIVFAGCPAGLGYLIAYFAVTGLRVRVSKVLELARRGK